MPHLFLDYSTNMLADLDPKAMIQEIHETLAGEEIFRLEDFKSRIIAQSLYVVGSGCRDQAFMMLDIRTFAGKDSSQKQIIAERALAIMKCHCTAAMEARYTDISVSITEIDRSAYVRARSAEQPAMA